MKNPGPNSQNRAGRVFLSARLGLHRHLKKSEPVTREQLAQMALKRYGAIKSSPRRRGMKPDELQRWISKIETLERKPGRRALASEAAYQLCEILKIRRMESSEHELDLREIA